jgi:hypothetical protein
MVKLQSRNQQLGCETDKRSSERGVNRLENLERHRSSERGVNRLEILESHRSSERGVSRLENLESHRSSERGLSRLENLERHRLSERGVNRLEKIESQWNTRQERDWRSSRKAIDDRMRYLFRKKDYEIFSLTYR